MVQKDSHRQLQQRQRPRRLFCRIDRFVTGPEHAGNKTNVPRCFAYRGAVDGDTVGRRRR